MNDLVLILGLMCILVHILAESRKNSDSGENKD